MFSSNQHYYHFDTESLAEIFATTPIISKLTDFGESRSDVVQTATMCNQRTINICRGSPVYIAPEIFNDSTQFSASRNDLKAVDMWALGMVFFILLKPDLDYPYSVELKKKKPGTPWRGIVSEQFSNAQLPICSETFHTEQATDWSIIEDVFKRCLSFTPQERPSAQEVRKILERDNLSAPCRDIPLSCSQTSAIENVATATKCNLHVSNILNDGTNSCAFLSVLIMGKSIHDGDDLPRTVDEWNQIAQGVEDVITNAPTQFNQLRDISVQYDVHETYSILRKRASLSQILTSVKTSLLHGDVRIVLQMAVIFSQRCKRTPHHR